MRVAMIGTGYVGLVSGACFADFGHVVTCVDKDARKIDRLHKNIFSLSGSQTRELFQKVLVPYLKDFIRRDMKGAPFSLVLGEATGGKVSSCAFYFSRARQSPITVYLGPVRFDRDDINVLARSVEGLLGDWGLEGSDMLSLSTVGLSGACRDLKVLPTLLAPFCPDVMHHHAGSLSALSVAVDVAVMKSLPPSVEFLLRESCNWFADGGEERQHRYKDIICQIGLTS